MAGCQTAACTKKPLHPQGFFYAPSILVAEPEKVQHQNAAVSINKGR